LDEDPNPEVKTMSDGPETKQPTRKQREHARHHQEILEAAESLFAGNGYFQTTMQMIADQAEFSVGYLYKHFNGKEDMYREMLDFHLEQMEKLKAESNSLHLGPLEGIHHTYTVICQHFNKHPGFMRIFHEDIGGEFCQLSESKRKHHGDLVEKLGTAQKMGQLDDFDCSLLAAAIQGATKELFAELASRPGDRPFDPLPDLIFSLFIDPRRT
jgi:AcrR family transcriptional regulator